MPGKRGESNVNKRAEVDRRGEGTVGLEARDDDDDGADDAFEVGLVDRAVGVTGANDLLTWSTTLRRALAHSSDKVNVVADPSMK